MYLFYFSRNLFFLFFFLFEFSSLVSQNTVNEPAGILFYNVENFFNPDHNEGKDDLEFTPDGERGWNRYRQITKENNICRVILYAGKWNPPVLVGLCEVEDQEVLKSLIFNTGLHHLGYSVEHFESPDRRGVDVALLYRTGRFKVLKSVPQKESLGSESGPTRDILYVKGVLDGRDTLHVMVNHWPSRWGGEMVTKSKRKMASDVLRNLCDSILQSNPNAAIVAMGDFNDGPGDESIRKLGGCLFNLAENIEGEFPGTLKYRHEWDCFDQILVSSGLLPDGEVKKLVLSNKKMKIISAPFMMEDDPQFPGKRLKRTYLGYQYLGGFSDHLPVYVELIREASL